jgi:hypothetical protein
LQHIQAFGVTAGRLTGIASCATYGSVLVVPSGTFVPVMAILGALMVAQYVYWRQRRGAERTTRQYLDAEPIGHRGQRT